MNTINVKEPESGAIRELRVQPVNNFAFPGWVVFIPERGNILLYLQNEEWKIIPGKISLLYARRIGEKLSKLALI